MAQLGQDQGGFYSIVWLENLVGCRITNADRIVAAWQDPHVGDRFPLHPDMVLRIAQVDAPHALVVAPPGPGEAGRFEQPFEFSWAFVIRERPDAAGVRLVARERYRPTSAAGAASVVVGGLVSTLMTSAMLAGIRERVGREASAS